MYATVGLEVRVEASSSYEAPWVVVLGSVEELTKADNKIGAPTDIHSADTGIIGSITPFGG